MLFLLFPSVSLPPAKSTLQFSARVSGKPSLSWISVYDDQFVGDSLSHFYFPHWPLEEQGACLPLSSLVHSTPSAVPATQQLLKKLPAEGINRYSSVLRDFSLKCY